MSSSENIKIDLSNNKPLKKYKGVIKDGYIHYEYEYEKVNKKTGETKIYKSKHKKKRSNLEKPAGRPRRLTK